MSGSKKIEMLSRVKLFVSILILSSVVNQLYAQGNPGTGLLLGSEYNAIQTPVPFLNISPDSRASAMGDVGAATKPDVNSMHWNPAKYAFIDNKFGFGISYSPWLHNIANDISLMYLSGYYKVDRQNALGMSLRYFSLGTIIFKDYYGKDLGSRIPYEVAVDFAYSRLFSEKLSGAMAVRYIYSDLTAGSYLQGSSSTKAGVSYSADISVYYKTPLVVDEKQSELAFGLNVSNIGTKISYSDDANKEFIPTNLRLGTAFTMKLDPYNSITVALDLNKLLVPTPDSISDDKKNISVTQGIFQSFYDAPRGFKEEMEEIMIATGAEYNYRDQFYVRGGYFFEDKNKGNRKYFTAGLGVRFNFSTIDISYLIPTVGGNSNPLANTYRVSFLMNVGRTNAKQQKTVN